jgi:hypothetical protein
MRVARGFDCRTPVDDTTVAGPNGASNGLFAGSWSMTGPVQFPATMV